MMCHVMGMLFFMTKLTLQIKQIQECFINLLTVSCGQISKMRFWARQDPI